MNRRCVFLDRKISVLILLVVSFSVSATAHAQWSRTPPPPDSPYWWTLSDEVTPSELYEILQDRDLHQARFRATAESGQDGVVGETVTEQRIRTVRSYLDGRRHPELVPMYIAFESFAAAFEHRPGWREESPRLLKEHGVSAGALQKLQDMVPRYAAARERVKGEVRERVAELMQLLSLRADEVGNETLMKMLVEGDIPALARLTGRDAAEIARLQRAWKREPIVETALPALVQLRADLSPDDWDAFRRFLLFEVAPSLRGVDYGRGDA